MSSSQHEPRTKRRGFYAVVGHEHQLERADGAVALLRALGAQVRTLALWDDPDSLWPEAQADERAPARALVVEVIERVDWVGAVLRALRRAPALAEVGAVVAVSVGQVACLEPSAGFDDFVLVPYVPAELYARVRGVEWRRSEFATEERIKLGPILIDRAGHEVTVDGAVVSLTAREFALLVHLCERRGCVVSRREALARVWGQHYEGGERTVDIHVRRLRQKLGDALPLETLRGAGYKVEAARR